MGCRNCRRFNIRPHRIEGGKQTGIAMFCGDTFIWWGRKLDESKVECKHPGEEDVEWKGKSKGLRDTEIEGIRKRNG